jgi:hypothetical protein
MEENHEAFMDLLSGLLDSLYKRSVVIIIIPGPV